MSVEDDYDSIDGIINNGNKQQEYEKLKKPERKSPLSRSQLKKMLKQLHIMSNSKKLTIRQKTTDRK